MGQETADTSLAQRAMLTQQGMQQFEGLHAPVASDVGLIVCEACTTAEERAVDWPCARMTGMLLVQALAMLQSMIPSGNMSAILSRFAGGGR